MPQPTSQSSPPTLEDNDALLTYRIGPVYCCGPTLPIITITPPPKLTHPPGANIAEPGIFKHKNHIVTTTDLRYRFGVKQENWKQPGQVIIAQHGNTTRGYFVDEIIDVIRFPQSGWGNLPPFLPRGVFSRTLLFNEKIYLYADFEKLSALQGSGYLAEYIEQLDKQEAIGNTSEKTKTSNTAITIKKDRSQSSATSSSKAEAEAITQTKKGTVPTPKTIQISNDSISEKGSDGSLSIDKKTKLKNTDKKETFDVDPPSKITQDKSGDSHSEKIYSGQKKSAQVKSSAKIKPQKRKDNALQHKKGNTKENSEPSSTIKSSTEKLLATTQTETESPPNIRHPIENNTSLAPSPLSKSNKQPDEKTKLPKEPDTSNFILISLVFIVLLFFAIGYYYYTNSMLTTKIASTMTTPKNTNAENYINRTSPENSIEISPENLLEKQTSITEKQAPENIKNTKLIGNDKNEALTKSINKAEYSATIAEKNDTITIELSGPQPPKVKNTIKSNESKHADSLEKTAHKTAEPPKIKQDISERQVVEPEISKTQTSKSKLPRPSDNQAITKKTEMQITYTNTSNTPARSMEIIHVIVKGDTLWAIAKKYLQNPFLYPELAKLSKIKNPDLIYPGNRVHIIYRGNKSKQ